MTERYETAPDYEETGELIKLDETKPFVRTPYNYNKNALSESTGYVERSKGRTKQEFAEDADINVIVKRFKVGQPPKMTTAVPMQEDFLEATTYQEALNLMMQAEQSFMELPSNVRARFHNDPAELLQFIEDDNNREEAEKLGIITKRNKGASSAGGSAPSPTSAPASGSPAGGSAP